MFGCNEVIENVTNWLNEILKNISLKQPSKNEEGYELVNPKAYSMFIPIAEMGDRENFPAPCVLVQFSESTNYLKNQTGNVNIILHIMVWNPGTHHNETSKLPETLMKYERNADGVRDALFVADLISGELRKTGQINHHRIVDNGIKIYPYKEQNAIIDFYPYFFMDMEFTVENYFAQTSKNYENLL